MNIPKTLKDLTLKDIEPLGLIKEEDEMTFRLKEIAVLTKQSFDDIYNLPIEEANKLINELKWFFVLDPKDIDVYTEFEYKGIKYELMKEMNELSFGQFVDLEASIKRHQSNYWTLTKYIMALCSKIEGKEHSYPKTKKELEERIKIIEEQTLDIVFGYTGFFLTKKQLWKTLSNQYLLLSSHQQNMGIIINSTMKNGDGKGFFMTCVMEIFLIIIMCVGWVYMNVYGPCRLKMKEGLSKLKSIMKFKKN